MKTFIAIFIVFCISCEWLLPQNAAKPAFEVASIKPIPSSQSWYPGTHINGLRFDSFLPLNSLIETAYRLKSFQLVGPDWLRSERFEIHSTIPEGVSKNQVSEMLQTLLETRFKLVVHREEREQQVYALVVAKGGPKLKKAINAASPPVAGNAAKIPSIPEDGGRGGEKPLISYNTPDGQQVNYKYESSGMIMTGGSVGVMRTSPGANGTMRLELPKVTMAAFAEETLSRFLVTDRPVVDKTGLKGSYQVMMEIPFEELLNDLARQRPLNPAAGSVRNPFGPVGGSAPTTDAAMSASAPASGVVFRAVQKLGLKLQLRKVRVEKLVIDHIEKNPTEN